MHPTAIEMSAISRKRDVNRKKFIVRSGLTTKAEPPPTRDVNRDSGTDSANGG